MVTNFIQQRETDEDEEVIIDDLDDLLDTMSPLSDQVSDHESMQLHTDDSDNDDSIEKVMYIENDDDEEDEEDEDEEESDNSDINEEYENNIEHSIVPTNWSTTDDEEDEEEVDMFSFSGQEEVQFTNESSNTYDNIVSAFMHSLAPNDPGGAESNGTNTPILRETEKLSAFELANALSLLSSFESENQTDLLRRPSLPSSTVSAAQRHRGSQDFNSETLCNLSNIMTDDISLTYDTMHASSSSNSSQIDTPSSLNIQEQLFDFFKSNSAAVENKKRLPIINETTDNNKKRRMSLSREEPTEGITMDDLVDTSQLHSDEENNEQDHPYSRDLNRWQRIPIGAFRLMRSKNKLWLER